MAAKVLLRRPRGGLQSCPFGKCLVSELCGDPTGGQRGSVPVAVHFEEDKFEIQLELGHTGNQSLPMAHKHPLCPARDFAESGHERSDLHLRVGVAVLLQSADGKVLLTRRQQRLRSFPGLFVLPGGNLDKGESLVNAGIRELMEETGVQVSDPSNARLLCLWESTYPLAFEQEKGDQGLSHHHLVIYVLVHDDTLHSKDCSKFSPQVSEVGELVWVSKAEIHDILNPSLTIKQRSRTVQSFLPDGNEFEPHNWAKQVPINSSMVGQVSVQELSDNVVIGTRFALQCFLECSSAGNL